MPGVRFGVETLGPGGLGQPADAPPASSSSEVAVAQTPAVVAGLKAIGEVLLEAARSTFAAQRDPWGNPWRALAPATVIARARKLGVTISSSGERSGRKRDLARAAVMTILVESGALSKLAATVEDLGVSIGVTGPASKYGAAQQFGIAGKRRWGRAEVGPLPAREFLPIRPDGTVDLPEAISREVEATLEDALTEVLQDIGAG